MDKPIFPDKGKERRPVELLSEEEQGMLSALDSFSKALRKIIEKPERPPGKTPTNSQSPQR